VIDQRNHAFVGQDEAGRPFFGNRAGWGHGSIDRKMPCNLIPGHRRHTVGDDLRVTGGWRGIIWLERRRLRDRCHARQRERHRHDGNKCEMASAES
jgi:hypothetical protein